MSGHQTPTPKRRGSTGNGRKATGSRTTSSSKKRASHATETGDDSPTPDSGDKSSSSSSAKKLKIFHYFGAGLSGSCSSPAADGTPEVSRVRGGILGDGEAGKGVSGGGATSGIARNGKGTTDQGSPAQDAVTIERVVGEMWELCRERCVALFWETVAPFQWTFKIEHLFGCDLRRVFLGRWMSVRHANR